MAAGTARATTRLTGPGFGRPPASRARGCSSPARPAPRPCQLVGRQGRTAARLTSEGRSSPPPPPGPDSPPWARTLFAGPGSRPESYALQATRPSWARADVDGLVAARPASARDPLGTGAPAQTRPEARPVRTRPEPRAGGMPPGARGAGASSLRRPAPAPWTGPRVTGSAPVHGPGRRHQRLFAQTILLMFYANNRGDAVTNGHSHRTFNGYSQRTFC